MLLLLPSDDCAEMILSSRLQMELLGLASAQDIFVSHFPELKPMSWIRDAREKLSFRSFDKDK